MVWIVIEGAIVSGIRLAVAVVVVWIMGLGNINEGLRAVEVVEGKATARVGLDKGDDKPFDGRSKVIEAKLCSKTLLIGP